MDCTEIFDTILCINLIKETYIQRRYHSCHYLQYALHEASGCNKYYHFCKYPNLKFSLHLDRVWAILNFFECKLKNLVV